MVTAVARARAAQPEWAANSLGDRRHTLRRFQHLLVERRGEIASLIEREAGKPAAEAMTPDVIWHGRSLRERLSGVWRSVRLLMRGERSI